jgi:hypothetical protein
MMVLMALLLVPMGIPEAISAWRSDLERQFGVKTPIVYVGERIQGDPEGLDLAHNQLRDPDFQRQFAMMQAAMVSHRTGGTDRWVVILNMDLYESWKGYEEALLGHELGHIWLRARRLPTPAFRGGDYGCLAVHTGDVVQHVLIRAEMDRRGIDHRGFLMKNLDDSARAMEERKAAGDPCAWARQAALWVDARLAFAAHPWPGRARYEAAATAMFPESGKAAAEIIDLIAGLDLDDPLVHRQALMDVFSILSKLAVRQKDLSGR